MGMEVLMKLIEHRQSDQYSTTFGTFHLDVLAVMVNFLGFFESSHVDNYWFGYLVGYFGFWIFFSWER